MLTVWPELPRHLGRAVEGMRGRGHVQWLANTGRR